MNFIKFLAILLLPFIAVLIVSFITMNGIEGYKSCVNSGPFWVIYFLWFIGDTIWYTITWDDLD